MVKLRPQSVIFKSGDQADYLYIVKYGEVQIIQEVHYEDKVRRDDDLFDSHDPGEIREKEIWKKLNKEWKRRQD